MGLLDKLLWLMTSKERKQNIKSMVDEGMSNINIFFHRNCSGCRWSGKNKDGTLRCNLYDLTGRILETEKQDGFSVCLSKELKSD